MKDSRMPFRPTIVIAFGISCALVGALSWPHLSHLLNQPSRPHQAAVTRHLVDPSSAQFRNVHMSHTGVLYCGEVNSRNRLGGYTGFRRYMLTDDQFGMLTIEPSPNASHGLTLIKFEEFWRDYCVRE